MSDKENAQLITPPNTLKAKLGAGSGGLDPEAIKRAEKAMDNLKTEFSDWIVSDITHLNEAFAAFAKEPSSHNAGILFRAAHDLKGQAATFEYPLIARVAGSLSKLMDGLQTREAAPLALVEAHVDAIHVIHRDKIKDISNLTALTLVEALEGRVVKALARAGLKS
jgi:chemotaxis protein histidine kinase CheA